LSDGFILKREDRNQKDIHIEMNVSLLINQTGKAIGGEDFVGCFPYVLRRQSVYPGEDLRQSIVAVVVKETFAQSEE
jgi:hypothetical protein